MQRRKNRRRTVVWMALFLSVLCGCAGKTGEPGSAAEETAPKVYVTGFTAKGYQEKLSADRIPIAECGERYGADTRALRDAEFQNLHFTDCAFADFPQTEQLDVLDGDAGQAEVPLHDCLKIAEDWLARTGQTDEVDLKKTLRIVTDRVPDEEKSEEYGSAESQEPPEDPLVYEHLSELDDKLYEGELLWLEEETCSLDVDAGGIVRMSTGRISDYIRSKGYRSEAGYDTLDINSACIEESGTLPEMKDRKYPLPGGELSVEEGAELAEDYLQKECSPHYAAGFSVDIPRAEVFRLPDGVCGYRYCLQMRYRDVPFTTQDGSGHYNEGDYLLDSWAGSAFVADGSEVCAFASDGGYDQEMASLFSGTEMLSLSRAAELMSRNLAPMLNFDVESAGLVYLPVDAKDDPDGKISGIVLPCWEFVGTNRVKQEEIFVYVDAFTGELYYHTDNVDEESSYWRGEDDRWW